MPGQDEIVAFSNALFKHGIESNQLKLFESEYIQFLDIYSHSEQLSLFLLSPRIKKDEKKELLKKVLGKSFSKDFLAFVNVILAKRCQPLFQKIFGHFQNLVDKHENITRAKVYSVSELKEKTLDHIKDILSKKLNKNIIITPVINKKIIGGIVLEVEDKRVDLSVLHNLSGLKDKIIESKVEDT